jgi:hypothetical protein
VVGDLVLKLAKPSTSSFSLNISSAQLKKTISYSTSNAKKIEAQSSPCLVITRYEKRQRNKLGRYSSNTMIKEVYSQKSLQGIEQFKEKKTLHGI